MPRHKVSERTAKSKLPSPTNKLRKVVRKPEVSRQQAFDHIVNQMTEFFDAGVVSVTWQENGQTCQLAQDVGNKFAVTGLVEDLAMDHSEFSNEDDEDDDKQHA